MKGGRCLFCFTFLSSPPSLEIPFYEVLPMNVLASILPSYFEPVSAPDFYRDIFPEGELESEGVYEQGKYTGIAVEITKEKKPNGKPLVRRYSVCDELNEIDSLLYSSNFCVMAPISYAGKERKSSNARILYALCIEIDGLKVSNGRQVGLNNLMVQWSEKSHWIPVPTYVVASGNGLHLYYVFEKGIPLFKNVVNGLQKYKRYLTEMLWNRNVTILIGEKIQYESLFQAFRMPGTITKSGDRVQAFRVGDKVNIEYMNSFVPDEFKITQLYKSELTLSQAKEKYPEWFDNRIVQKQPKGHWICKRDLYEWWKRKIENGAMVGHRYYCLMMLCIYAIKCDIPRDELEQDCFHFLEVFEERTNSEDNHFTEKDVMDALQAFEDKNLITYPVNSISNRSGIAIEKNKRNGRKQDVHLKGARAIQQINDEANGTNWRQGNGRKSKKTLVEEWQRNNPNRKKADCIRETGLSKPTVLKWWIE